MIFYLLLLISIAASALITADTTNKCKPKANGTDSSGSNSGGSTTTGSGGSGSGSQSSTPITPDEIKALVLARRKADTWEVGAPTGKSDKCPDEWIYNGKSKCFKEFGQKEFAAAQSACAAATSDSGPIKMAAGDAELLKFEEDEDFITLHYGFYKTKCMLRIKVTLSEI